MDSLPFTLNLSQATELADRVDPPDRYRLRAILDGAHRKIITPHSRALSLKSTRLGASFRVRSSHHRNCSDFDHVGSAGSSSWTSPRRTGTPLEARREGRSDLL